MADDKRVEPLRLVPRMSGQGYGETDVADRRAWLEEQTGAVLKHVAACSIPAPQMRGNIENPIGSIQMPLGVAGPLKVNGDHAKGTFYVPMATTEGALIRSYERGMAVITRAGGADVSLQRDENSITPNFYFQGVADAAEFCRMVLANRETVRREAESTTQHGKLIGVDCTQIGRQVMVRLTFSTGDAQGMNMISKAADKACQWLAANSKCGNYEIFSGSSSEKRAGGGLFGGGKGKRVTAGVLIPAKIVRTHLRVPPHAIAALWRNTMVGQTWANVVGYNGHLANGLTAVFIATGQDVANIANSAVGLTVFEVTDDGDLYASVTLPALSVATIGGGTALGSSAECLSVLGCAGSGKAAKLAEIIAATCLAGELSFGAAIAGGKFVEAHETYGRNRPEPEAAP